ncbi:cysteine desulfurase family protein (TIGR01976 family) [Rhizobium leguminosarum]|uniref:Cysteine desulfurase family protein (TIGR01976 family) n=1 Tax=Rhizobium leguminosarum TaxID=384 RepID=A0AAE2MQY5_RHILE|nr:MULTISPECIES: cysteine desulfurase-like protein [Rhizobium]ARM90802.1 aminotransferase class V/cysteine desulfurase protein [Rhizobium sp. CIAT894]MBB4293730.1 cysteine desulfurase family protein (TIGR01976 family) [Rhizobium leguminosarum]MBB4299330.1 cysteine desulfurase family protein (TIGR01976 family) [Rhizobium leguminosarum]MBB4310829.1 cysteine desulfurase family protein (TIGR01976 family) [Rhizobium leguminosarum]MBB4420059.1 cysteine desulfurase family protein (TIGR01976 family) [
MAYFPIDKIRAEFPALAGPKPPIYLDNPAGTLVPRMVIDAVANAMATASNNLGGYFAASARAVDIVEKAHDSAAQFVGATSPAEMIVGPSMTNLTLHMSRSIGLLFNPGDEIIVTRMDHEGDVAPWLLMARDRGLVVKWLPFNRETWRLEPEDLRGLLTERTRLVALNYASNLTGSINDIAALTAVAKSVDALVYVDAVQYVPHHLPDVVKLGCDFLACSSYKFFGPHLAVLWGRKALLERMEAYKCRCASDALPDKYETGTPQTELQAGLSAAADYAASLGAGGNTLRERMLAGYHAFNIYEDDLTRQLITGLQSMKGITIHGITNLNELAHRVPTVSFTHAAIQTHDFAQGLANQDICVWSGHNYAIELVRQLGLDEDLGVVRIGIAHYNTAEEIDRALNAIDSIIQKRLRTI